MKSYTIFHSTAQRTSKLCSLEEKFSQQRLPRARNSEQDTHYATRYSGMKATYSQQNAALPPRRVCNFRVNVDRHLSSPVRHPRNFFYLNPSITRTWTRVVYTYECAKISNTFYFMPKGWQAYAYTLTNFKEDVNWEELKKCPKPERVSSQLFGISLILLFQLALHSQDFVKNHLKLLAFCFKLKTMISGLHTLPLPTDVKSYYLGLLFLVSQNLNGDS